jgi:glycerol uptake facilitator-like aquaporin
MNQATSLTTGGITISAATLEPAVSWALTVITHAPVPESVSVLVTGLLGAAVHAAVSYVNERFGAKPVAQQ